MRKLSLSTIAIALGSLCVSLHAEDPAGAINKAADSARIGVGSLGSDSQLKTARSRLSDNAGLSRIVPTDSLCRIKSAESLSAGQSVRVNSGLHASFGNSLGKGFGHIGRSNWSAGFDGISVRRQEAAGSIPTKDFLQTSERRPGLGSFDQEAGQVGDTNADRIGTL